MAAFLRTYTSMFHGETHTNEGQTNRSIRMLPFALAAGLVGYGLAFVAGAGPVYAPVAGAIIGGWTLGRLMRRPEKD